MSQNIVPVKLNSHLIPFFYKEFEGEEANYRGVKVKACKIAPESSLGFMIKTLLQKCEIPVKHSKFYVYISFNDSTRDCTLYNVESGKNNFLYVPEHLNKKLNTIFEDLFRLAFQYHTQGMLKNNPELYVRDAIESFMVEYKMDDYGFQLESIRKILNRGRKNKLSRLQKKVGNRFLNF